MKGIAAITKRKSGAAKGYTSPAQITYRTGSVAILTHHHFFLSANTMIAQNIINP